MQEKKPNKLTEKQSFNCNYIDSCKEKCNYG